jgi:hypothetical protein
MGIQKVIARQFKQRAVYWGSPNEDGYGGKTFADAIEIACRWEEMRQVILDTKGNQIVCRALIFVNQDLDEEGYLYLGNLTDLVGIAGTYIIFTDGTTFIRKGMRGGVFCVDKAISELGFGTGNVEGTDWINIMGTVVSVETTPLADAEAPISLDGAWIIKRFQKTPSLDGKEYLRKAYLA